MKNRLIEKLNNNEVIGHTTDTVIGLIAKVEKENIFKINQLKERSLDQPLQLLISNYSQIENIIEDVDKLKEVYQPMTSYMVKVKDDFSHSALLPSFNRVIMVRLVEGELAEIINEVGPLFATSANKHQQEFLTNWEDVEELFGVETNKKNQEGGKPSKIISLINNEVKIIRE